MIECMRKREEREEKGRGGGESKRIIAGKRMKMRNQIKL